MFLYVTLLVRTYIRIFAYVYGNASLHIYIYFRWLLMGRGETKKESVRKEEWVREGANRLMQSEFLFLSNFMVAKSLFWFEYEISVLWCILLRDDDDD